MFALSGIIVFSVYKSLGPGARARESLCTLVPIFLHCVSLAPFWNPCARNPVLGTNNPPNAYYLFYNKSTTSVTCMYFRCAFPWVTPYISFGSSIWLPTSQILRLALLLLQKYQGGLVTSVNEGVGGWKGAKGQSGSKINKEVNYKLWMIWTINKWCAQHWMLTSLSIPHWHPENFQPSVLDHT